MADTNFVNGVTRTDAEWFQDVNDLVYKFDSTLNYALGTLGRHLIDSDGPSITDFPWLVDPTQNAAYNTPKVQAAIDWCVTNKRRVTVPFNCVIKINSTLIFRNSNGFAFGSTTPAGALSPCVFEWDGANNGTMFLVDRCREAEFCGIAVRQGTGSLSVGWEVDQQAGTGTALNTSLHWKNCKVTGTDTAARVGTGWYISRVATSNNDLHEWDNCWSSYCTDGWRFNQSQTKFNKLLHCTANFCVTAINCQAGSFITKTINLSNNDTDVFLAQPSDTCVMLHPQSESADRYLNTSGATSGALPFVTLGGRLSPDSVHVDGNYIKFDRPGPLVFVGTLMHQGSQNALAKATIGLNSTTPTAAVFIGCGLPSDTFITPTLALNVELEARACTAMNASNQAAPYARSESASVPIVQAVAKFNGTAGTITHAKGITLNAKFGAGSYRFNLTRNQPDANYIVTPLASGSVFLTAKALNQNGATFDIQCANSAGTLTDADVLQISITR